MKIAIIGLYCTKFGELWSKSLQDLLAESEVGAIKSAKIEPEQIDMIFTGNMCSGIFSGQMQLGAMASEILNLNCPSHVVEGACASGGLAIRSGIMAIESGFADVVVVNGIEKMTDLNVNQITTGLMSGGSEEQEHLLGATFPGLNGLIAKRYMHKFGLTRNQLSSISVKNHRNAKNNPLAHFKKNITIEDVATSPDIATPLTVLDCAPISDGCASLILSSKTFAKKHFGNAYKELVYITGSGQASDTLSLAARKEITKFEANRIAGKKSLKMADITQKDIDLVEIHDGFTITEIISLEDLGFFEKGQAGIATGAGETSINGKIPVNASGGLKGKGHPVGATGVSQCYEMVLQLQGRAGKNQVKNANIGLIQNMGGAGTTSVVHILSKN